MPCTIKRLRSVVSSTLQISLLGDFKLVYDGEPVSSIDSARLQSLLAYLMLHAGVPQPRQHLAFSFWPDSNERQALANLRNLLHHLRRSLPEPERFLHVDGRNLMWRRDGSFALDVFEFEQALRQAEEAAQRSDRKTVQGALKRAGALYRGDLLPGCYDDWVMPQRERLHQAYTQALERLLRSLEDERRYEEAIAAAQRLLQHDPLREASYRTLMRLYALAEDRAGVRRVYESCVSVLKRELDVEPDSVTRSLYEGLYHERAVPVKEDGDGGGESPPELPLVGRQHEWDALRAAWESASCGQAMLAVVSGEAGIGKTHLAEEILRWITRQGHATGRARCYAASGHLAYAPVAAWLRSPDVRAHVVTLEHVWLSELYRLLPELGGPAGEAASHSLAEGWQRQRFFEALSRAVLAAGKPVFLLLDDIQWSDPDTIDWLRYLFQFAPQAPLLIVATLRDDETPPEHPARRFMLELHRTGQAVEVSLAPLAAEETAELAAHLIGRALDRSEADHLYRDTEGHPLFVVESLRAALADETRQGIFGSDSAAAKGERSLPAAQLPPTVQAVLEARLAQLSSKARTVAGVAAVIGRAFSVEVLSRAGSMEEEPLAEALDELWEHRIIRELGAEAYDFTHDKLRDAAYALVGPARRRILHRRVAEALERTYGIESAGGSTRALDLISAQVAAHCEQAGLTDRAVLYYERAARAAYDVYANAEVVALLTRALRLLKQRPESVRRDEDELRIQMMIGPSLVALTSYSAVEVRRTYERARTLCERLGRPCSAPILRALAAAYAVAGEPVLEYEMGRQLLDLAVREQDPLLLAEGHYLVGVGSFWLGEFAQSRIHLEQAISHYTPERHTLHVRYYAQNPKVVCLSRLGWTLWYLGYPDQARACRAESVALARELGHPHSLAYALSFAAQFSLDLGDPIEAAGYVSDLKALADEQGFALWANAAVIWQGAIHVLRGDIKEGQRHLREGHAAMDGMGVFLERPYTLALLAQGELGAGHPDRALERLDEAFGIVERGGERFYIAELYRQKGELLLADGADDEAEENFRHAVDVAREQEARSLELRATISLARHWHAQGRTEEARQSLESVYRCFTEGFDTQDLKAASNLLRAGAACEIPVY